VFTFLGALALLTMVNGEIVSVAKAILGECIDFWRWWRDKRGK
jgi:hypothetical protein